MLRTFSHLFTAVLLLMLLGCGTTYVVTTKSGQTYTADGPLDLDVKDNTYTVKDENGNPVVLKQDEVDKITEQQD